MLDAYIIDAIRREERARDDQARVQLELPVDPVDQKRRPESAEESEVPPSVIIIPVNDTDEDETENEAA